MNKKWIFIGPTLYDSNVSATDLNDSGYVVLPPAQRGDIESLINTYSSGEIVLADGTFHHFPAVSHAEIRNGLEKGWTIFGISSMGAIRAVEMDHMGMIGYGRVYAMFKAQQLDDDEVALLFAPQNYGYKPLSEPMIHFRVALDVAVNDNLISPADSTTIANLMKTRWYGHRTLTLFKKTVREHAQIDDRQLNHWLNRFPEFRIKSLDLEQFMKCPVYRDI